MVTVRMVGQALNLMRVTSGPTAPIVELVPFRRVSATIRVCSPSMATVVMVGRALNTLRASLAPTALTVEVVSYRLHHRRVHQYHHDIPAPFHPRLHRRPEQTWRRMLACATMRRSLTLLAPIQSLGGRTAILYSTSTVSVRARKVIKNTHGPIVVPLLRHRCHRCHHGRQRRRRPHS